MWGLTLFGFQERKTFLLRHPLSFLRNRLSPLPLCRAAHLPRVDEPSLKEREARLLQILRAVHQLPAVPGTRTASCDSAGRVSPHRPHRSMDHVAMKEAGDNADGACGSRVRAYAS